MLLSSLLSVINSFLPIQQSAASSAPIEQASPPMAKTEDIPEPSSEEREKFITELKQFHLERGTPMTRPPVLSQKTLDLYRLYHLVQEYGGMEKVNLVCTSGVFGLLTSIPGIVCSN